MLDHPARVAVHFAHRLAAVVATLLIAVFAWQLRSRPGGGGPAGLVVAALVAQIALGISIVIFGVPLTAAVAHNGMAALLLLALIYAHQRIWQD